MPALIHLDSQRHHEVDERMSIGRGPANQLRLDDPMVSPAHAEIVRQPDGSYVVRDLGSRHGTFVGAHKISEAPLRDGDELLIGPVRLRFDAAAKAASPIVESDELRRLRAVVELSRAIGVEHDLDRLLERVLETCFQLLRADRGMIIVYAPHSKQPSATVARMRDGTKIEDALSTSVLSQIMATHEPYLRTEVDGDLALKRSESLSAHGVRSLVAVPLLYQADETEWLGVIHLDSQATNNVFSQRDLELLVAIAGQAALAIKNAMLVRQVQAGQSEDWQRLERVVKSLPVGVVVLDDERRCVLVNEWVTRRAATVGHVMPGTVIDKLAGVACEGLVGGDVREQATIGAPESTYVINAHTSDDGREAVVVISDITEERNQQTKAAHQDRLALIGQLAGGIAHDFNNLLHIIVSYTEMLQESVVEPQQLDDVGMVSQAASSATDLVRQLLAFSRREAVKPKVIEVGKVVAAMETLLKRTIGKDVELAMEISAEHHQRVLMDPSQLEQIMMNLIVNARDAMTGPGRVDVRIGATPGRVTLTVTDTGCGMPPDLAARIFEPYFTTKEIGKGTGLGLATVHGIVEHARGDITVTSEPGRGTTFHISLPTTDLAPEKTMAIPKLISGRVLLVDDDVQIRRLTERMLRHAGYEVCAVASGPDALAELHRAAFDILLTDMVMPGMSGRDLAREVARDHPRTRIIFMSGYHPGTPIPAWQFLAKPFDRQTLLAKLGDVRAPAATSTARR